MFGDSGGKGAEKSAKAIKNLIQNKKSDSHN